MSAPSVRLLPILASAGLVLYAAAGVADDSPPAGWRLTWSDEFAGEAIDRTKWDFDLGNGFYNYDAETWISGWGNGELQFYTREPENALVRDGQLHLRAIKESWQGCGYTSARLKTRRRDGGQLFAQTFGRFEIRARCPVGQGLWPAIWMLPQDDRYGTWAASGEIDILEVRGQRPDEVVGTLHYGGRWPANVHSGTTWKLPDGGRIDEFHVYALEWEPGVMRWSVDGREYARQSHWWSTSGVEGGRGRRPTRESDLNPWPAPFDQPFYLILNLAVGGQFAGKPDATTVFPAEFVVDYVRIYEREEGYGPTPPRGAGRLPFE